jgi:hypothetical protein
LAPNVLFDIVYFGQEFLMVGSLLILSAVAFLFPTFTQTPEANPNIEKETLPEAQSDLAPVSPFELLGQAYQLAGQYSPGEHARHMEMLISAASRMRHPSVKQWVTEFFQLTQNLPNGHHRLYLQKDALTALSQVDPEQALRLLGQLEPLSVALPANSSPSQDLRAEAASLIFVRYWKNAASPDVAAIRAVAEYLSQTGQYPFIGIASILRDVAAKDPLAAESLFFQGIEHYQRVDPNSFMHSVISSLLNAGKNVVPDSQLQMGIGIVVDRLLAQADQMPRGMFMGVRSMAGSILRDLLPLVKEFRPDLEKQILGKYPDLREAPTDRGANPKALPERVRVGSVQRLARSDPHAALEMSSRFRDPSLRAAALAGVIQEGLQRKDPAQAASVLKEIEAIYDSFDPEDEVRRLGVLVSLARGQAARDDPRLWETLSRGLDVAEDLFVAQMRQPMSGEERDRYSSAGLTERPADSSAGFNLANDLMRLAAREETANALGWLSQPHDPVLKSYLLISAAEGLWDSRRPAPSPAR